MYLQEQIPKFYHQHLPAVLLEREWNEIDKCQSCLMACGEKAIYKNDLKCCTYYPFIPNYQVGEILLGNSESASQIQQMIQDRQFVLPVGLCAPENYQQKYSQKKENDFGNREDLLCPFFDQGKCKTWQHRTSECVSFQCYSSYGQRGLEFWKTLGEVMHKIELFLSQELMLERGYLWPEVERNLSYIKIENFSSKRGYEDSMSRLLWGDLWQHQKDRIDNYFVECYKDALKIDVKGYLSTLACYRKLGELFKPV